MTVKQIVIAGNSLSAGKVGAHDYQQGGNGSWPERVANLLGGLSGLGPRISAGIRLTETGVTGLNPGEWTGADTWNAIASESFDRYPYGHGAWGNLASQQRIYTVPAWMPPLCGFAPYWIDMNDTVHIAGNWSYKVNSGSYTAMGQTLTGNNGLKVFYVSQALVAGDVITIRCATTAGVDAYCLPVGIEPYFLPPTTTTGFICHNIAIGGTKLNSLVATTAGDRMAFFDSVTAGTGSPIVPHADLIVLEHVNDVQLGSTSGWNTDLGKFHTRINGTPMIMWSPWEVSTAGLYPQTDQTNYRAQTKTTCAAFSPAVPVLDIYDQWSRNGRTGNGPTAAAGLLESDVIHESQYGHDDLTPRLYWYIRNALGINGPSQLAVTANRGAVQYSGKQGAVQYSAGAPINV